MITFRKSEQIYFCSFFFIIQLFLIKLFTKGAVAKVSPKGILLIINRSIQSEGAFGAIKQNYAFRQFLLRGKKKMLTEILLVAMGCNINKLHAKTEQKRLRTQLFEKLSA